MSNQHKIVWICLAASILLFVLTCCWAAERLRQIDNLLDTFIIAYTQPVQATPIAEAGMEFCSLDVFVCPDELDAMTIPERITKVANDRGWDDPAVLIRLAKCESTLDPNAVGGALGSFRGLYQWNKWSDTDVTDDCAFDIECSTNATITALELGQTWKWPVCY